MSENLACHSLQTECLSFPLCCISVGQIHPRRLKSDLLKKLLASISIQKFWWLSIAQFIMKEFSFYFSYSIFVIWVIFLFSFFLFSLLSLCLCASDYARQWFYLENISSYSLGFIWSWTIRAVDEKARIQLEPSHQWNQKMIIKLMQDACPWYKTYVLVRGETNKWFADISIVSLCQN